MTHLKMFACPNHAFYHFSPLLDRQYHFQIQTRSNHFLAYRLKSNPTVIPFQQCSSFGSLKLTMSSDSLCFYCYIFIHCGCPPSATCRQIRIDPLIVIILNRNNQLLMISYTKQQYAYIRIKSYFKIFIGANYMNNNLRCPTKACLQLYRTNKVHKYLCIFINKYQEPNNEMSAKTIYLPIYTDILRVYAEQMGIKVGIFLVYENSIIINKLDILFNYNFNIINYYFLQFIFCTPNCLIFCQSESKWAQKAMSRVLEIKIFGNIPQKIIRGEGTQHVQKLGTELVNNINFKSSFASQNCGNFCYYLQNQKKKMSAKGKGKGKGKGLKIDGDVLKKFSNQHDGALDSSYFVECQMQNGRWFKSRILDCRLAKDYDATRKKDEASYQYYIHYQPLNRRNDQWVSYKRIKKINQKIVEEDCKKKGVKKHEQKKQDNYSEHFGMDHASLLAHQEATKFKTIHRIQIGKYKSETWYYSPYPIYYHNIDCLYLCEFCLSFFSLEKQLKRHSQNCPLFHPPGDEIYRDQENKIAVFEVDGSKNPVYCQNLGFLSKLFLDHKNLEWDMSIFLFYILCEIQDNQYHITGYFSKPKDSINNLSCILTLPFHQRKGYGKFLITFSYELSLIQNKFGTPEKPLSDLGKQTYLSWWSQRLIDYIREHKGQSFTVEDIVKETAMTLEDIQWTMEQMGIVKFVNGVPHLCIDEQILSAIYKKVGKPGKRVLRDKIHWVPYKLKWDSNTTAI